MSTRLWVSMTTIACLGSITKPHGSTFINLLTNHRLRKSFTQLIDVILTICCRPSPNVVNTILFLDKNYTYFKLPTKTILMQMVILGLMLYLCYLNGYQTLERKEYYKTIYQSTQILTDPDYTEQKLKNIADTVHANDLGPYKFVT